MDFNGNMELKKFSENLHLVILPSTLWAVHIDPEYHFIAILHIQIKSSKLNVDKGIVVTFDGTQNLLNTSFYIQNEVVRIPALNNYIKAISDLSHLIYVIDNLKICPNVNKKPEYPQCNKYIDLEKFDGFCSSCLWIDKKVKTSNLWRDLNCIQDLHCTSSVSSDETAADNVIEENLFSKHVDPVDIDFKQNIEYDDTALKNIDNKFQTEESSIAQNTGTNENENLHQQNDNNRSYVCEFCDRSFFTKGHHKEHMKSHSNEKPFLCGICNKASSRRSAHQRHVLTHSNLKPNLCNVCGKTFCQGYRMKDHLLTHSSERPFKCEICHKTFSRSYNLKLHQKTHTGVRSYVCSTCGKTYTTQSNLTTHIKSAHTNKKPHACPNCNMMFVHPRYLRIHMRKHTGEKPYKCMICSKTFAKNIHLKIHIRTHTGEKPHVCSVCGKGFTTTGNLSSHKRVHHKDLNIGAVT